MNISDIRKGLEVYLGDRRLGTVEDVRDNNAYIGGRAYPLNAFSRFENNRLYLADTHQTGYQSAGTATDQNQISVPVVEEQLKVGKREVSAGEVHVNKRVVEEQQSVPVELRREEVRVEERDLPDRPLRAGEVNAAFQEGTIRVPVMAEEAVVAKEALVTGEVVLNKSVQTENQQVSDTVRKEQVEVLRDQQGVRRDTTTQNYTSGYDTAATGSVAPVRPVTNDVPTSSAASATSGNTGGQQLEQGMEVYGSDQESIGQVKEVRSQDFLIDRPMARDIYAPYSAIQTVTGNQVVLNMPASEAGSQGWPHPSLGGGDTVTAY